MRSSAAARVSSSASSNPSKTLWRSSIDRTPGRARSASAASGLRRRRLRGRGADARPRPAAGRRARPPAMAAARRRPGRSAGLPRPCDSAVDVHAGRAHAHGRGGVDRAGAPPARRGDRGPVRHRRRRRRAVPGPDRRQRGLVSGQRRGVLLGGRRCPPPGRGDDSAAARVGLGVGAAGPAAARAVHDPRNRVSRRVAERVGYAREGVLRSYQRFKGRRMDAIVFSLLPEDLSGGPGAPGPGPSGPLGPPAP